MAKSPVRGLLSSQFDIILVDFKGGQRRASSKAKKPIENVHQQLYFVGTWSQPCSWMITTSTLQQPLLLLVVPNDGALVPTLTPLFW